MLFKIVYDYIYCHLLVSFLLLAGTILLSADADMNNSVHWWAITT